MELKLQSSQGQIIKLSFQQLETLMLQACQEKNIPAQTGHEVLNKISKYLEIFLLNPGNVLSNDQFISLITNICNENNQPELGETLSKFLNQNNTQEIKTEFSFNKVQQEKLKKLYLPPAETGQSFADLVHKIAYQNNDTENAEKLIKLFDQSIFFPDHYTHKILLKDDLDAIFEGLKTTARNFQNHISTCIDFSKLRPKLSLIRSIKNFSSGPISFIKIYAATIETLRQSISSEFTPHHTFILNIHHPDILEYLIFIKNFQKNSLNAHCHFKIEITSSFLEALSKEENFELISPENSQIINLLSAKHTFDLIISTIQENPQLEITRAINSNSDNELTISGLFNLAPYGTAKDSLEKISIDLKIVEKYLFNQQKAAKTNNKKNLRIRLNFTGWHDFLIGQEIPYASIQALEMAQQLVSQINNSLGPETEKGVSLASPLLAILEQSHGLETYQSLSYSRTSIEGAENIQLIEPLQASLNNSNLNWAELTKIIFEQNSLKEIYQIPVPIKNIFTLGQEIPADFHFSLQKIFETGFGNNVEKMIFLERHFDLEEAKKIFQEQLLNNLLNLGYSQFQPISRESLSENQYSDKNYLHSLHNQNRRRHREIQPPLFQLKKTEEIKLPPINSSQK